MSSSGAATPVTAAAAGSKMGSAKASPAGSTVGNEPAAIVLKPIDKSGHYGHLSPEQAKSMAEYEKRLEQNGALPDPALSDEEQRVTVLGRYLRARDWSVENATKMYLDTLKWRKEVDLDGMVKDSEQGKDIFPERKAVADAGWKMYFHKTDRYNRPIFVQDLGHLKVEELFTATKPERIINFFAISLENAIQYKYRACTKASRDKAQKEGVTDPEELKKIVIDDNFMIINAAGLGMGTFWAFKGQLQQLLAILDANFPDLSGRIQIINAPWLFSTIFSYIKGWLPVATAAKVGIAGTDFHNELFTYIDPSALPSSLGGTCQCSHPDGCAYSNAGPWQKDDHVDSHIQ